MIIRDAAQIEGGLTIKLIQGALAEHDRRTPELERMRAYYDGEHRILRRVKTAGTSNNRLVVNHAKYIVDLAGAYLVGGPIGYDAPGQPEALAPLLDAFRCCDIDAVDAELAKHAGIFGRAVELAYIGPRAMPRVATADPRHAFVVYDDTVAHAPLLGIHRAPRLDERGRISGFIITAHTDAHSQRFAAKRENGPLTPMEAPQPHYFGAVPLVEYWNNEDERGDFAPVTTLIDAYNLLLSDRINDKEQLVEAILMISGASLGDTEPEISAAIRRLRDQRVLEMPASGADARYLIKQLAEGQAQILADALARDIHKIAMVPALTDADFAGQASGVAMRFKLLGLEQLTRTKERWFREGLRSRLRLFAAISALRGAPALDPETVRMTFSRGLPVNDLEQARMVDLLRGVVPDEVLVRQLSFV